MDKQVCIFSAQYLPSMGGVERYTDYIAKKLSIKNVKVTIVTSGIYDAPAYEETDNIKIYRLPSIGCMKNRYPIIKLNTISIKMLKEISVCKYDLVIVNTRFYILSVVGAFIGKKRGARCICIEHGTMHMTLHNVVMDKMEQIFEHFISGIIKIFVKDFYGVSQACNEWLRHFHIEAVGTLCNSIDLDEINRIINENAVDIRQKYYLPKDGIYISFVGRILKEKGILQLLDAYEQLRKGHPNVYLIIAGDGPLLPEIQSWDLEGVHYLGKINYDEVILLLNQTEIFCLPSDSEGMPTSVLEAIACENFIITTERGGAKEIISDSSYGIVLSDNQSDKVYNALWSALTDKEYRKSAVKKCYGKVSVYYTWDNVIGQIQKIMSFGD